MIKCIVHVKLHKDAHHKGIDLEVPAEIPMRELVKLIIKALRWNEKCSYEVFMEHSKTKLSMSHSLLAAKAWTGTTLVFKPNCSALMKKKNITYAAWFQSKSGNIYPITDRNAWIGRKGKDIAPNQAPLIDLGPEKFGQTVSRRHARVMMNDGNWVVRVESTKNPSILNGKVLKKGKIYPLEDGDVLQLGGVTILFFTNSKHKEENEK